MNLWSALKAIYHRYRWIYQFDVWLAEGMERHSGAEFSFVYAGFEPYFNYLAGITFTGGFSRRFLGRAWPPFVEVFIRRHAPAAHMAVFEISKAKEPFFRPISHFESPLWIRMELDLSNLDELAARERRYENALKKIKKYGFSPRFTTDPSAFEDFYHRIYMPYVQKRHNETAVVYDYRLLKRIFLKNGELVLVMDGETALAGALVDWSETNPHGLCLGIRDASEELQKMRLSDVVCYFELLRARERGSRRLNLGHFRAFLHDHPLQYKKSFGARLVPAHHEPSGRLAFRLLKKTDGLKSFFAHHPLIAVENGRYRYLPFGDDASADTGKALECLEGCFCGGLEELEVKNVERLFQTERSKIQEKGSLGSVVSISSMRSALPE